MPEAIDLTSSAFKRDPRPTLARLRAEGPLRRTRLPLIGEVWLVTRHEAVLGVLKDADRFVVDARNAGRGRFDAISVPVPRLLRRLADNMLGRDDPEHRRLRGRVERAFRRRSVGERSGPIAAAADAQLARLEALLRGRGRADALSHFARPLPLAVITDLLGLPEADRPRFLRWAHGLARAEGAWSLLRGLPGLWRLSRYLEAEFARQRETPREGLIAGLLECEADEDPLSGDELLAMVFLLLLAGHETTTHLLAGGLLALLQHPELRAALVAGPEARDRAVEELLRFVCPVQLTKPRYAVADTELWGARVARGEVLMPLLAAANLDPEVFRDPERLDPARDPNPHLAFGSGVHVCLGLQLARAEARLALSRLVERLPGLRLAVPESQLRWTRRLGIRALRELPVALG